MICAAVSKHVSNFSDRVGLYSRLVLVTRLLELTLGKYGVCSPELRVGGAEFGWKG